MKKENNYSNFLYYKVVGQKVRSCRIAKGYTQKDLAKKISVTYQIVLQYEKGTRKISIEKLCAIAKVLSIIAFLIIVRTGHRKAESTARRKDSNRGMFFLALFFIANQ